MQPIDAAPLDNAFVKHDVLRQLHLRPIGLHLGLPLRRPARPKFPVENGDGVLDLPFPLRVAFPLLLDE